MRTNIKFLLALSLLLLGFSRATASESFLGVYGLVSESTLVDEDYTVFAPISQMRVRVSLTNEEGLETFSLIDDLPALLDVELSKDGLGLPSRSLEIQWAEKVRRYSLRGPPDSEVERPELLEPGAALETELALARRDGRPFSPGAYELLLRVRPERLRTKEGEAWIGRGGLGGQRFLIREIASLSDRKFRHAILGKDHLLRGDHHRALAEFLAVVDLDPADLSSYANLGLVYSLLKDHEAAIWCFEKALPMMAGNLEHSYLPLVLATSYVSVGERSKAVELLSALSSPTSAESQVLAIEQRLERNPRSKTKKP